MTGLKMLKILIKETLEAEFDELVEVKDTYETINGKIIIFEMCDIEIYYNLKNDKVKIYNNGYWWEFEKLGNSFKLIESLL